MLKLQTASTVFVALVTKLWWWASDNIWVLYLEKVKGHRVDLCENVLSSSGSVSPLFDRMTL